MKLWKLKDSYISTHGILNEADASFNKYEIADVNPDTDKYDDISSIENFYANPSVFNDYLQMRRHIDDLINTGSPSGWDSLTTAEKQILIDLHLKDRSLSQAANDTNKVVFLMTNGLTLEEAQGHLINAYAEHHVNDKISCTTRANSKRSAIIVAKYLQLSDATDFINEIKNLLELYISRGIKGIEYDSLDYGLFDYFKSTPGSPYEFTGLASNAYALKTGTLQNLIDELLDVLWLGKY